MTELKSKFPTITEQTMYFTKWKEVVWENFLTPKEVKKTVLKNWGELKINHKKV